MMNAIPVDMWHLIQAVRQKMFAARRKVYAVPPPIQELFEEFGITVSNAFIGSLPYMLSNYDRSGLSTAHYRVRNVYDNPAVIERQLAGMAADGLLEKTGEVYRLTDKGLHFYNRMLDMMRPRWQLTPEMAGDIQRILDLMQRLIASTAAAPEPPAKWSFTTRQHKGIARPDDIALLEQLDWHIFDLWAYRDDVHLAAWAGHDLSPFAWEALTLLWQNKWDTLEKVVDVQVYREFTAAEWTTFLAELLRRGWIEAQPDRTYALTETGKTVRDAAERLTDEYFYAPWSCLSDNELAELRELLTRLDAKFSAIAAA